MRGFGRSKGGGRRDEQRQFATLSVLLTAISKTYEAELGDISATGARLRACVLPSIGEEGELTVGRVRTFCKVRWRNERECGVQFYEPLAQMEVIGIRREARDGTGLPPVFRAALDDWVLGIAR